MIERIAIVEYECQHLTCRMDCHKGTLKINDETFDQLKRHAPEKGLFKSTRNACKMNTIQDFKMISVSYEEAAEDKKEALESLKKHYSSLIKRHRQEEKEIRQIMQDLEMEISKNKEISDEV